MRSFTFVLSLSACLAINLSMAPATFGAITWTGSVEPADPSTTILTDEIYAGYSADGTIEVTSGSTLLGEYISIGDGGTGVVTVDGLLAGATATQDLNVGYNSQGTLNVKSGATVIVGDELVIGYDGTGTLNVESGATVSSNGYGTYVGYNTTGHLSITGGSTLNTLHMYPGYDGDGYVDISGAGSVLNVNGGFYSGYDGGEDAFWTLNEGGKVNFVTAAEDFYITYEADSTYSFGIGDDGTGTTQSGMMEVAGTVIRDSGDLIFALTVDPSAVISPGDQFVLIDYDTWDAGTFQVPDGIGGFMALADGDTYSVGGHSFVIDYAYDLGGGDLAVTASLLVVPEPSSVLLLSLASMGAFGTRRRS